MSEGAALTHVIRCALSTAADTAGLESIVTSRLLCHLERHIYVCDYPSADAKEFAAWSEEIAAELLSTENIEPLCPFAFAAWFGKEVFHWLSGGFDDDSTNEGMCSPLTLVVLAQ